MQKPDWPVVRKDPDNKMPRCGGGGAAGRFRTSGTKGGGARPVMTSTVQAGVGSAHSYKNALPI